MSERTQGHRGRPLLHWLALLAASAVLVGLLEGIGLAGAPLLGAMAAGIVVAARRSGPELKLPPSLFVFAQGAIGVLIASHVPAWILGEVARAWPILLLSIVAVVGISVGLGYAMARGQALPGTTAVWGFFPGGATVMVVMAGEFGADARLVAFMQYLRVGMVALVASIVARIWLPDGAAATASAAWFTVAAWPHVGTTLLLAGAGAWLGRRLRVPAGALLLPLAAGILLQDTGAMVIELPRTVLMACYCVVGWSIGLRFTPAVLVHARAAFPRIFVSMAVLLAACGVFAALLTHVMHIDPMTAYLATSPGGIDAIAIISASSPVDVPFIMAMQTSRMLAVLAVGPLIARSIAARALKQTHGG